MKNVKAFLVVVFLIGTFADAFAQYGYEYGPPPPPPRHQRQQNSESSNIPDRPSGYFEVSVGLANPTGNFATAFGTGYNGYALPGHCVNLSLGVPVDHTNIGVAFMYGSCNNSFDIDTYVNNIQYMDPSKSYGPLVQDEYNENFILGGLFWTWPVQRLSFDARIMGGIALCNLPEVTYGAVDNLGNQYTWDTQSSSASSFAYDFGADIRYSLRRASIMLGVDYTATNPTVNTTQYYTDPNNNVTYTHISGSVPVSVVSINLGIAYQINMR